MKASGHVGVSLLVLVAAYTIFETVVLTRRNAMQPGYIADEECHIPQVQRYCQGNFSYWDTRITTLPGLYLLSVGVLKPLSVLWGKDLCTTFNLRFNNVILSAANLALFFWIIERLHSKHTKGYSSWKALLAAFNLALFPPLHFFSYLYYTDMAAAFILLLVYYFHIIGRNLISAVLGILATLVRQTNIVWVLFVALRAVDVQLQKNLCLTPFEKSLLRGPSHVTVYVRAVRRLVKQPGQNWVKVLGLVLVNVLPFLVDGLLFAWFLVQNQALVVGDRTGHTATIHIPQLFYYCGFTTLFAAVYFIPLIPPFLKAVTRNKGRVLLLGAVVTLIIHYNTLMHPYLVADNRHYTYHVWMQCFHGNAWGKYFFLPLYMFGAYSICRILLKSETFLSTLAFWVCATLVLTLQKLIEVRYFLMGFVLFKLHVRPVSWKYLISDTLWMLAINSATVYMYVTKTIYWPNSAEAHRYMW